MFQALENVHKRLYILTKHVASSDCKGRIQQQKNLINIDLNYQSWGDRGVLWSFFFGLPLPHQLSNWHKPAYKYQYEYAQGIKNSKVNGVILPIPRNSC